MEGSEGLTPEDMQEGLAALGRMAAMLAHYLDSLIAAGFSRDEALRLAVGYQAEIVRQGKDS